MMALYKAVLSDEGTAPGYTFLCGYCTGLYFPMMVLYQAVLSMMVLYQAVFSYDGTVQGCSFR